MDSNTLHIDELLSNTYAGFEPTVPAFAWDGISAALDAKKRRRGALLWFSAAASLLLVVGVAWFGFNHSGNSQTASTNTRDAAEIKMNSDQSAQSKVSDLQNAESQSNGVAKTKNGQNAQSSDNRSQIRTRLPFVNPNKAKEAKNLAVQSSTGAQQSKDIVHNSNSTDLFSLGVQFEEIPAESWNTLHNGNKLENNIGPLDRELGNGFYMGLGVGQLVSATGFTVNPNFGNYVHKNFTRHMAEGQGLLASLSFNGSVGYRFSKHNAVFAGVNYYQRKNSLNFDFTDEAPALNAVNNPPLDKFGRYPIKDYLGSSSVQVNYKGTNTITAIDFPIGWMGEYRINRSLSFVPMASANLGMLSLSSGNTTLDYQFLDVVAVDRSWYRKGYVLMNTSAGLYKDLGKRIKWGVNATANYTVTQMYVSGATIRPRAFTGGLTTQIIWRLD